MDLGRAESIDTLVRRREAVARRLSSSLHQAELVDTALAALDRQLADGTDVACADSLLRASARALLTVAVGDADYDATLTLAHIPVDVRIHNTLFGLQIDVIDRAIPLPTQPPAAAAAETPAHHLGEAGLSEESGAPEG
jgi:hypothetical protein